MKSRGFFVVFIAFVVGIAAGFFASEYYHEKNRSNKISQSSTNGKSAWSAKKIFGNTQEESPDPEPTPTDTVQVASPVPVAETPAAPDADGSGELASDTLLLPEDTLGQLADDFFSDEEMEEEMSEDEGIVIKKEQLLATRLVKNILPPAQNITDSVDAILEQHLSISPTIADKIVVEFWKSPVNFKGYKFNRKKLVLYGLVPQAEVKLCNYIHVQYLIVGDLVYRISETAVYQPYQLVESASLKEHLKKYVG